MVLSAQKNILCDVRFQLATLYCGVISLRSGKKWIKETSLKYKILLELRRLQSVYKSNSKVGTHRSVKTTGVTFQT